MPPHDPLRAPKNPAGIGEAVTVSSAAEEELVVAIDESYEEQRLGTLTPAWEHLGRPRPAPKQRRAG
jgi:hypothetical protein